MFVISPDVKRLRLLFLLQSNGEWDYLAKAIRWGNLDAVKALVEAGANIQTLVKSNKHREQCNKVAFLCHAARHGQKAVFDYGVHELGLDPVARVCLFPRSLHSICA